MKIGMVCPYSFDVPGGVQAHVVELAEVFIDRGHTVSVLAPAADETVLPDELSESIVQVLQKVQVDDDDAPDDVGSLAASAEALRLTAAAPPRNQNAGGDYE